MEWILAYYDKKPLQENKVTDNHGGFRSLAAIIEQMRAEMKFYQEGMEACLKDMGAKHEKVEINMEADQEKTRGHS